MPRRSSTGIRSRRTTAANSPAWSAVLASPVCRSTGRIRAGGCCAGHNRRVDEAMWLDDFNGAEREAAIASLRPCADITRWCEELADGRPYRSVDELMARAEVAAAPFTADELEAALAHHPRKIGRAHV